MNVLDFYSELDHRIPGSLSCDWDNDGLMCCPDSSREVKKVLVALDATGAVTQKAAEEDFDVILTHHPLLFKGLKTLSDTDVTQKKAITLVRSGVAVMSFHTRLDALPGGVNDRLAAALGLFDTVPFGTSGKEPMGRIGTLPRELTLETFAKHIKKTLGAPSVLVADAVEYVYRVAVLGGEGKDEIEAAVAEGADTFVSGRFGYHAMTDAADGKINLIEAGHFWTENPVCQTLRDFAQEILPEAQVQIVNSHNLTLM